MTVDFAGSAPQVAGNLNAVEAIVRSATWYCVRLLAEEDLPVNHGCFDPVTVITPPHSLLNPDFPAAVAVGNTETGQRVTDVVLGALAQALPDRIPAASQGTMNNFTVGGAGAGSAFVYYETIAGGHGASPAARRHERAAQPHDQYAQHAGRGAGICAADARDTPIVCAKDRAGRGCITAATASCASTNFSLRRR